MANVFFGRKGRSENRASTKQWVSVDVVVQGLKGHEPRYFNGPPVVNGDETPSEFSAYTLTVVEIDEDEICAMFPRSGYYWFPDLTMEQCCTLLGVHEPQR